MDITFLFVSLLGMSLSILILFFNKGYKSANLFLACFFFFISLYLLDNHILLFNKSTFWVAIFITSIPSFFFLVGPLSFLYVRSIIKDNTRLSLLDYLHFALFLYAFLGTFPFLFSDWTRKQEVANVVISNNWNIKGYKLNVLLPSVINQGIRPFHWLFYLILNWRLFHKKYKSPNDKEQINNQFNLIKRWLFIFCIIFTVITIFFFTIIFSNFLFKEKVAFLSNTNHFLWVMGISYIALNISLLLFPHILYGLPIEIFKSPTYNSGNGIHSAEPKIVTHVDIIEQGEIGNNDKGKYTQLFSAEYIDDIALCLKAWQEEMKYTNPDCSLISLSLETKIPFHHLSYYFNTHLNYKFIDWRNKLRIEKTCKEMQNGKCNALKLESIALNSGFAAQSTFIRAFKVVTGITPSDYMKQIEKERG
jgi:AraC-like DNA-binding protein